MVSKKSKTIRNKDKSLMNLLKTELIEKTISLFNQLENNLNTDFAKEIYKGEKEIIYPIYIIGGMAVNFYTGERTTYDVDIIFPFKIIHFITNDIIENYGEFNLFFDIYNNPNLYLLHKNYQNDAILIDYKNNDEYLVKIKPYVVSPSDLAITKILRLSKNDIQDIINLYKRDFFTIDDIKNKAMEIINNGEYNKYYATEKLNQIVFILEQIKKRDEE